MLIDTVLARPRSRYQRRQCFQSMRPDEHKKKQRADYKKKHGISNKKTTSKEKTETAKTVNPTETQEGDGLADTSQVRFDRLQNVRESLMLIKTCTCYIRVIREITSIFQGERCPVIGIDMKILKVS